MVRERRIVAKLLLAGADDLAWKAAIYGENRLQKARPATSKQQQPRRTASALSGFHRRLSSAARGG